MAFTMLNIMKAKNYSKNELSLKLRLINPIE